MRQEIKELVEVVATCAIVIGLIKILAMLAMK